MRQRKIGGKMISAMTPSQRLPPLRLERAPATDIEKQQLRTRCLQIVFRLQGSLLSWKEVQTRAATMERDALAEASRQVREPTRATSVLERPQTTADGMPMSKGGIILPTGGLIVGVGNGR